jgi:tRNA C32,U32 (ribose-2'-O)-methylase TrmJ
MIFHQFYIIPQSDKFHVLNIRQAVPIIEREFKTKIDRVGEKETKED